MKVMGGAFVLVALVSANVSAASRNVSWDVDGGRSAADKAWLDSLVGSISAQDGSTVASADPDLAVLPSGGNPDTLVVADADAPAVSAAGSGDTAPGSTSVGTSTLTANLLSSGIPVRVLKAYLAAASITTQKDPACHLSWSLLAGIGRVESNHGRFGGSRVDENGRISPPIFGPRLVGTSGMALIRDTDDGRLDGDTVYDRAVGPMQFLPGTWKAYQADADADGLAQPQDIDDAALTAAHYLCAGNGDLATQKGRWNAVLRYNRSVSYAAEVISLADSYATGKVVAATAPPTGVTVPTTSSGAQGSGTSTTGGSTTLAPQVVPAVEQPTAPLSPAPETPAATPITPAPDAADPRTTTSPATATTPAATGAAEATPSATVTTTPSPAVTTSPEGSPSATDTPSPSATALTESSPSTETTVTAVPVTATPGESPATSPSATETATGSATVTDSPSAAASTSTVPSPVTETTTEPTAATSTASTTAAPASPEADVTAAVTSAPAAATTTEAATPTTAPATTAALSVEVPSSSATSTTSGG